MNPEKGDPDLKKGSSDKKQAFLDYLKTTPGLQIEDPRVSSCEHCFYHLERCPGYKQSDIPLSHGSYAIKTGTPAFHCLNWRKAPAKLYEPLEKPQFTLNKYPCLRNFFPNLKINVTKRWKFRVAKTIVSVLHHKYPGLDYQAIFNEMKNWNDQLKTEEGIFRIAEERLKKAIKEGMKEKNSCAEINKIPPLQRQCTSYLECLNHDGTIEREPGIIERLGQGITKVILYKGDNTETTEDQYTIYFEDNTNFTLSHKQLMTSTVFEERCFQVFGKLLLPISRKGWRGLFNDVIKPKITHVIEGEKIGTEEHFLELFIDHVIEGVVYSWEEANPETTPVYDFKDLTLWVPSKIVDKIKEQIGLENWHIRKLRRMLDPLIARNVEPRQFNNIRYWFWIFKAKKLGIEPSPDILDAYINSQKEKRK